MSGGAVLDTAVEAARAGGAVIQAARADRRFRIREKSKADFVTEVDLASQEAIVDVVRRAHPEHAILAEEDQPDTSGDGSGWRWVIDPLDGTTNFIRDFPAFAVSVSVERAGRPVAAAVLDVAHDELYTASRGKGAFLDGRTIEVSEVGDFSKALWLTGIPFRNVEILPRYLPGLERMAGGSLGIRRFGSAALDLCHVACGRAEGFWEYGLSRWDVSAGVLVVEEAGGRATDLRGGQAHLDTGDIAATNGRLHDAVLGRVSQR